MAQERDPRWEGNVEAKLEVIMDAIERFTAVVEGNGREGLIVQTDRNTQDLKRLEKFVWMVIAGVIGLWLAKIF
jgi:hypothetical protein